MSGNPASPASSEPATPGSGLWLCFAVREEAAFLNPGASPVLLTGMGAVNALRSLSSRLRHGAPRLLLTCGFAGGLDPSLPVGAVLLDADEAFPLAQHLLRNGARRARFHAVDRVVITASEKRRLRESTGADAVEMESRALREECQRLGIPSATLRVISDAAEEDMPVDFNRVLTSRMRLSAARLALALVARPSRIRGLLALRRNTRLAARRLAGVLQPVVAGP